LKESHTKDASPVLSCSFAVSAPTAYFLLHSKLALICSLRFALSFGEGAALAAREVGSRFLTSSGPSGHLPQGERLYNLPSKACFEMLCRKTLDCSQLFHDIELLYTRRLALPIGGWYRISGRKGRKSFFTFSVSLRSPLHFSSGIGFHPMPSEKPPTGKAFTTFPKRLLRQCAARPQADHFLRPASGW
jgi:hypothetical protein